MTVIVDEFLEPLPLYPNETEETIRARWDAWANEGLNPATDVDEWTDTREGGFFQITTQPGVREAARIYDLMGSEVPAASNPLWAWESYLDDHAAVQDLERLPATRAEGIVTFTGPAGTVIAPGFVVGVEPVTEDAQAPEYETLATVTLTDEGGGVGTEDVAVRATEESSGSVGNVGALAVTQLISGEPEGVSVSNANPIVGGTETESDPRLRSRLLSSYIGRGPGNRVDYERWAREEPGVGRATVIGLWDGPGTVLVVITDPNGQPVPNSVVASLQTRLDPTGGEGGGEAPVGAVVTVTTATALNITVAATIEFEEGYSLDGADGTIALGPALNARIEEYIEGVTSSGEVVRTQVVGKMVTLPGVHDVSLPSVLLNGVAGNVAVPSNPARIPNVSSITLTAGSV